MSQHNGIEEELGTLKTDIRQLHSDLSSLADGLTQEGRKQWEKGRKAVEKNAKLAYSNVAGAVSDIAESGEAAIGDFEQQIGKRPLISVAAALGIGYCLGKFLGRGSEK